MLRDGGWASAAGDITPALVAEGLAMAQAHAAGDSDAGFPPGVVSVVVLVVAVIARVAWQALELRMTHAHERRMKGPQVAPEAQYADALRAIVREEVERATSPGVTPGDWDGRTSPRILD